MPGSIITRDAVPDDAEVFAANLRVADVAEIRAMMGDNCSLALALRRSIAMSAVAKVVECEGRPVILLGCAEGSQCGVPWLVATAEAAQLPKTLTRTGRAWTAQFMKRWGRLQNFVAENNRTSVKWLARLGFTIHPAAPFGVTGERFHEFTMGS